MVRRLNLHRLNGGRTGAYDVDWVEIGRFVGSVASAQGWTSCGCPGRVREGVRASGPRAGFPAGRDLEWTGYDGALGAEGREDSAGL
jgi:hypothetical protein